MWASLNTAKPQGRLVLSWRTTKSTGSHPITVSTFMNKFRKLGFISYNDALEVHIPLLNVVMHDNPHLRREED